jgi:hypothetical protein
MRRLSDDEMERYYKGIVPTSVENQIDMVKIELLNRILDVVKKRDVR